ncbi:hypothetical protein TSUD_400570 [Trifolium subterraneum]|uniref:Uncharacterized protein n=1 Tax=Trifolium subterraneum TaxID=3900 RepID=A0A2Z6P989_TRISU|nr:hypothetical protein TSUD_400570 [Trifolium subterraneum]
MGDRLEVVVHHGGGFEEFDHNGYVGAEDSWFVDEDYFSYFEFVGEIKEQLNYPSIDTMWFYDPQDLDELVLLEDDMGANRMRNIAQMSERVHLYLMHPMGEPDIIEVIEHGPIEGVNDNGPTVLVSENGPSEGVNENGSAEVVNDNGPTVLVSEMGLVRVVNEGDKDGPTVEVINDKEGQQETDIDDNIDEEDSDDSALGIHFDDEEEDCMLEDNFGDEGGEDNFVDQTMVDENVVGENGQNETVIKDKGKSVRKEGAQGDELFEEEDVGKIDKGKGKAMAGGLSDIDEYNSEELDSGTDTSDNEDDEQSNANHSKFPTFKMPTSMRDYKWESGMYFACKQEFQEAIRCYAIHSTRGGQESWQLRSVKDEHLCNRDPKVKLLSSNWLGKKLHKKVKENPNLKLVDIIERTQQKWNLKIGRTKAARARSLAFDIVDGSFREQYTRFNDYAHELLRSNHGSTIIVTTTPFQGDEDDLEHPGRPLYPHFQRAYICFKGCKESFLKCRPIIGLDGAFLKGYYGGQILAAIGRDPNDQMLPIAFAVVEGETKETWKWFLELLTNDLGGTRSCSLITFISDQQKGLLPAMDELLPGVAHREMQEIKTINGEAFKHLIKIPPRHWSKSYFTPEPKCDTLVNNMSEAFNSVIVGARAKPIVTMIEEIRVYMMERWEKSRQKIGRYAESILPNIKKKLEREASFSNQWMVRPAGYELFEVRNISATATQAGASQAPPAATQAHATSQGKTASKKSKNKDQAKPATAASTQPNAPAQGNTASKKRKKKEQARPAASQPLLTTNKRQKLPVNKGGQASTQPTPRN